jgi:hypothetical protein
MGFFVATPFNSPQPPCLRWLSSPVRSTGRRWEKNNERIDAFLKDVLETRRRVVNAIRDGIRSYVAVYENLVRDPEQDKRAAA